MVLSISSSIDGLTINISIAASAAFVILGNVAIKVTGFFKRGTKESVASTTTPSVPSEPMKRCRRSSVVTAFLVGNPNSTISPSDRTTFIALTCCAVTPYFTQHIPPAFVAILPPIVDQERLAGSGR